MKCKGSALKRRIQCYPPPGVYSSLINYASIHGISNSEAAVYMMRYFFENSHSLPDAIQRKKSDKAE